VVPAGLVADVARAKLQADRGSPTPDQLALAEFIECGAFDRHLRRTRQIYRGRRDAFVAALHTHLPRLRLLGVAAGLHLMIELTHGVDEDAVVAAAARRSIRVYGARPYRAKPAGAAPALVVGYGGLPETRIRGAVKHFTAVLAECGEPSLRSSPRTPAALDLDTRRLIAPLAARGIVATPEVWDDPDVDWARFDLAVIRSCWDYARRRVAFISWAASVPRLVNPPAVLAWNTHKRI
jgi:hypothetical protein